MRIARPISVALHGLDHTLGRLGHTRRVLIEVRTPVCYAVLGPVATALQEIPEIEVSFTSEYPDRMRPLVGNRFVTHARAEWTRYDLYLNADPWAAARLRRANRRITFFHGVAGKYDLDDPTGLPMGFESYDRIAFINRDRMTRYVEAGVASSQQARLVGYPKLDRLASRQIDAEAVRESLGLPSSRRTALYAPTYSPASSLHQAGHAIIRSLSNAGLNVIVKLHDRSLDPDPRYNGGIDWRARMRQIEVPGRIAYAEGPDSSPYMAAADLLVTDHSSVGFEYLVLDRPLLVFDAPGLAVAARINSEKVALLRSAATVVATPEDLAASALQALAAPARLSAERQRVAGEMFYEPGTATARAVALVREQLGAGIRPTRTVPNADVRACVGGAS